MHFSSHVLFSKIFSVGFLYLEILSFFFFLRISLVVLNVSVLFNHMLKSWVVFDQLSARGFGRKWLLFRVLSLSFLPCLAAVKIQPLCACTICGSCLPASNLPGLHSHGLCPMAAAAKGRDSCLPRCLFTFRRCCFWSPLNSLCVIICHLPQYPRPANFRPSQSGSHCVLPSAVTECEFLSSPLLNPRAFLVSPAAVTASIATSTAFRCHGPHICGL